MGTMLRRFGMGLLLGPVLLSVAEAQTVQGTSFTYQGRLTEAGALASGPYDFQFVLYDAPVDGGQVGPTVALEDVVVTEGLFTVSLDFGAVFGSEKRWLELGVRLGADTGAYTPILPRQELAPGPSAIFSTAAGDSSQLGGVPASQFVQTDDPRMTDARDPLPGSPDYVQNGTVPQPGVSFNVAGSGAASVLDAATQYNLGGVRILSSPGTHNLFAGANAGASNTTGEANAFFGTEAGASNTTGTSNTLFGFNSGNRTTTGSNNSFFGDAAGFNNTTGGSNSFYGFLAGFNNTTGGSNSFFGNLAGVNNTTASSLSFFGTFAGNSNTTGSSNSFFGVQAGFFNTTGSLNAFFGNSAGNANTTGTDNSYFGTSAGVSSNGSENSFFGTGAGLHTTTGGNNTIVGSFAGLNNSTGSNNTFIGRNASLGGPGTSDGNTLLGANARVVANLINATAVGAGAVVAQSNSIVLGRTLAFGGPTNVGIGTTTPASRLHVVDGSTSMLIGPSTSCFGMGIAFDFSISGGCQNYSIYGGDGSTYINRPTNGTIRFQEASVTQVSIRPGGFLNLGSLGGGGNVALCRNPTGDVSVCSSSLRYKTDVSRFRGGLEIVERLEPIRFAWKESGQPDIGLAAEEVAEVEPLLAFRNGQGQIEGVNYSQLTAVLVNALKQQQVRSAAQEERLEGQQREIEALRALMCQMSPDAAGCGGEGPPAR
jgi:hypothetical protein